MIQKNDTGLHFIRADLFSTQIIERTQLTKTKQITYTCVYRACVYVFVTLCVEPLRSVCL